MRARSQVATSANRRLSSAYAPGESWRRRRASGVVSRMPFCAAPVVSSLCHCAVAFSSKEAFGVQRRRARAAMLSASSSCWLFTRFSLNPSWRCLETDARTANVSATGMFTAPRTRTSPWLPRAMSPLPLNACGSGACDTTFNAPPVEF